MVVREHTGLYDKLEYGRVSGHSLAAPSRSSNRSYIFSAVFNSI